MQKTISCLILFCCLKTATTHLFAFQNEDHTEEPHPIVLLNENTGWCWFQDERAIIDGDQLLLTGVTSEGANTVTSYHFNTGEKQTVVMNDSTFNPDDHNVGALLVRPDGRYLMVYAGHGVEPIMRYRISSQPGDISQWEPEQTADTRGRTTYSNLFRLSETGITYNFHRGIG